MLLTNINEYLWNNIPSDVLLRSGIGHELGKKKRKLCVSQPNLGKTKISKFAFTGNNFALVHNTSCTILQLTRLISYFNIMYSSDIKYQIKNNAY
jgi:hypothetical protein